MLSPGTLTRTIEPLKGYSVLLALFDKYGVTEVQPLADDANELIRTLESGNVQ